MQFQQSGLGEEELGGVAHCRDGCLEGLMLTSAGPAVMPQGMSSGTMSGSGCLCHPRFLLGD